MLHTRHETVDPAGTRAVDHWLSGLLFASLLSAIVVIASGIPFAHPLFNAIEESGVDAAMRARLWFAPRAMIGREAQEDLPPAPHSPFPRYVFVDIDSQSCYAIEKSSWCETRSPASPSAAARTAVAVLEANPRIVILDVPLWDRSQFERSPDDEFQHLLTVMAAHPETRVIATAPSRPSEAPGDDVIDLGMLPPSLTHGEIQFAQAFGWTEDGVMRDYPATGPIRVAGSRASAVIAPTLPYLAAAYARAASEPSGAGKVNCRAFPDVPALAGICPGITAQKAKPGGFTSQRLLFTLPGLPFQKSPLTPESRRYWGLYEHYSASDVVDATGKLQISPNSLKDRIVVIGTSAAGAKDNHLAPIGPMSGAEVLLNVTRAYFADAVLSEPSWPGKIAREVLLAAIGSLPFLAFWWLSCALGDALGNWLGRFKTRPPKFIAEFLPMAPAVVLFLPAIAAAAALMIGSEFILLNMAFHSGRTWDLFTPLAALSLEGLTHASAHVLHLTETAVKTARRFVVRRLPKVWRRIRPSGFRRKETIRAPSA